MAKRYSYKKIKELRKLSIDDLSGLVGKIARKDEKANPKKYSKALVSPSQINRSKRKSWILEKKPDVPEELCPDVSELNRATVLKQVMKIWKKVGLTVGLVAQKHHGIIARASVGVGHKLKAIDMFYKALGVYPEYQEKDPSKNRNPLLIFIQNRIERDLPLPKKVVDALEIDYDNTYTESERLTR